MASNFSWHGTNKNRLFSVKHHLLKSKKERSLITPQKLQYFVLKLQCIATTHVLHKTTNATTQNYAILQTKLYVHAAHTNYK